MVDIEKRLDTLLKDRVSTSEDIELYKKLLIATTNNPNIQFGSHVVNRVDNIFIELNKPYKND